MTLSIRVSTPQGLVFCSDSLVSFTKNVDVMVGGSWLGPGSITPDSPAVIADPEISSESFVGDTRPNNNKIMQISDLPLAISIAGYGAFLSSRSYNGHEESTTVPFESYKREVNQVISGAFKDAEPAFIHDIARCACFTLCCGAAAHTIVKDPESRGSAWQLEILGGGYATEDMTLTRTSSRWPYTFEMKVEYGGENSEETYSRGYSEYATTIMRASDSVLFSMCGRLPEYVSWAEQGDWFKEFCSNELTHCLRRGMETYYLYSLRYRKEAERVHENRTFLLSNLRKTCMLVGKLIHRFGKMESEVDYTKDGFHHLRFTDVIEEMWKLKSSDYNDDEIENDLGKLIDEYLLDDELYLDELQVLYELGADGPTPSILQRINEKQKEDYNSLEELFDRDDWSEEMNQFRGSIGAIFLSKLGPGTSEYFFPQSILAFTTLIRKYASWVVVGDTLFIDDREDNRLNTFTSSSHSFGLETAGQSSIVERITEGIGKHTSRQIHWEIYQQNRAALDQLGSMLGDRLGEGSEETQSNEKPIDIVSGSWIGKLNGLGIVDVDDLIINLEPAEDADFENGEYIGTGIWGAVTVAAILAPDNDGEALLFLRLTYADPEKNPPDSWGFRGNMDGLGFTGDDGDGVSIRLTPSRRTGSENRMIINEASEEVLESLQDIDLAVEPWVVQWDTLPLKTSIEISQYLMESTIKSQLFQGKIPTVGGEIKTVTITPDGTYKDISESTE